MEDKVAAPIDTILAWKQVVLEHATQAGIATKNGLARSLLANQSKTTGYADQILKDVIYYRVTSDTNPLGVVALKRTSGTATRVRVYEKLGVNRWKDHGSWLVAEHALEGEDGLVFRLVRATEGTAT